MEEKTQFSGKKLKPGFALLWFVLMLALVVGLIALGVDAMVALFFGSALGTVVALVQRVKWINIETVIIDTCKESLNPAYILLIVGMMVAVWLCGGTVPALIYYGLQILTPALVIPLAFLLCSVTSVCTGTAFGTMATMGLACVGVAMSMGVPMNMVVGAVISGAFFGDKMSPLSDSTNLAAAMSGTTLYDHIGSMIRTTAPASVIVFVLYLLIGFKYGGNAYDPANVELVCSTIAANFNLSILTLLPPIAVLLVCALRVPAILGLGGCTIFSVLIAMLTQGKGFIEVLRYGVSGFSIDTGVAMVDKILNRGGIMSMAEIVILVCLGCMFGGVLKASGILDNVVENFLLKFVKGPKSLVIVTMIYCYVMVFVTGSQPMGHIIPGQTMQEPFDRLNVHRKVLSRTLEDTATLFGPVPPWGGAAAYAMGLYGCTMGFLPFLFLTWVVPVFTLLYALTGVSMWHTDGTPFRQKKSKAKV